MSEDKKNPDPPRRLVVTHGSAVEPEKLEWWEEGLVLKGSINLLAAREGKGKSTIASSWAARDTRTGGTVLWIGTEESRSHVQVPRLIANGADMDKVIFLDVETDYGTGALMFPLDLAAVEQVIIDYDVTMMVLDPCKGLVPKGFQGNDDIAVRQYLEPISAMVARTGTVFLGLAHFGKRGGNDSGQLILGSIAWSQVARTVLSVADDPGAGTRVLTNTKVNFCPDGHSVEFKITGAMVESIGVEWGTVEWLGRTDIDARTLLAGEDDDGSDAAERTAAEHWLEDFLTVNGPTKSKTVKIEAKKEGISERTLQRAKKTLKVVDESSGFPRTSVWRLPGHNQNGVTGRDTQNRGATGATDDDQQKQNGATVAPLDGFPSRANPCTTGATGVTGRSCPDCGAAVPAGHVRCQDCYTARQQTLTATVTDLGARRHEDSEQPKLTAREWFSGHIAELQSAGHKTVKSASVLQAGEAAGFTRNNLRQAASAHPDVITVDRKGGTATWSIEPGKRAPEYQSAAQWLDSYLDRQNGPTINPDDARRAGETAGHPWHSVRRAAGISDRITSLPAHGQSRTERIWQINDTTESEEGTA